MLKKVKYYIKNLELKKHPEGGYFNEVYRAKEEIKKENLPARFSGDRNFSTSIYFLLDEENISHFHKIKSVIFYLMKKTYHIFIKLNQTRSGIFMTDQQ